MLTGVLVSFSFLNNKNTSEIKTITKVRVDTVKIFEPKQSNVLKLSDVAGISKNPLFSKKNTKTVTVDKVATTNVPKDKRVWNYVPLNNLNAQIQFWDVEKIRSDMKAHQFKNLDGLDINTLKEIRMAYYYDKLLWDVHERTDLGIGVIWAFLRIEAFSPKINESKLLQTAWNFGGIKFREGIHKDFVYSEDDCYNKKGQEVQCKFAKFNSYEEGMEAWAAVFNASRYKKCKSQKSVFDTFNCIYRAGYHTHNNVQTRKKLCERYWTLKKHFPK